MSGIKPILPAPLMGLFVVQLAAIIYYLYLNILTIGADFGVGLKFLAGHIIITFSVLAYLLLKKKIMVSLRVWVLFLSLLICWLAFRVLVDLGDLYYLKQITIATTGGVVLFFLLGQGVSLCYQGVIKGLCRGRLVYYVLLMCFFSVLFLVILLADRLHENYFVITGINGSYQRPGNFLSILYLLSSYGFVLVFSMLRAKNSNISLKKFVAYLSVFTLHTFLSLMLSQMIGSNSATGVILILYVITVVVSFSSVGDRVAEMYVFTLRQFLFLLKVGAVLMVCLIAIAFLFLLFSGFELGRLGVLGFGSGEVSSLSSRFEILSETFQIQAGFSPFFGNINVAFLVTGDEGKTLHNFFPYVLANLGVVGLCLVFFMFLGLLWSITIASRRSGSAMALLGSYRVYTILGVLFFANLSTGISWPVLWFSIGLLGGGVVEVRPGQKNKIGLVDSAI